MADRDCCKMAEASLADRDCRKTAEADERASNMTVAEMVAKMAVPEMAARWRRPRWPQRRGRDGREDVAEVAAKMAVAAMADRRGQRDGGGGRPALPRWRWAWSEIHKTRHALLRPDCTRPHAVLKLVPAHIQRPTVAM